MRAGVSSGVRVVADTTVWTYGLCESARWRCRSWGDKGEQEAGVMEQVLVDHMTQKALCGGEGQETSIPLLTALLQVGRSYLPNAAAWCPFQ